MNATIDRRKFIGLTVQGGLAMLGARHALAAEDVSRHCIVLWLNGGPSHLDTFDPKPGTKTGGPFKAIKTRVPDLEISEHLPLMADVADRIAIIRSMTSKEGNHERAQFLGHTGYSPNPTVAHPSIGSWSSKEISPPSSDLMSFVSINGPSIGPGFLGVEHAPFVVPNPNELPENTSYAEQVDFPRFVRRRAALDIVEKRFVSSVHDAKVDSRLALREKALRMMFSSRLHTFDLKEETDAMRKSYGENDFGRGCLLARRLVEAGVPFVEVALDGWDAHQDNFKKTQKLMGVLDPAISALIKDLESRALLSRTLVVCLGEFGRTPQINAQDGRDHHPAAWSAVLAGAGIRGGIAYGKTDPTGAKVVDRPVLLPDLFATIATLLGMNPDKTFNTPQGRPIAICDKGKVLRELLA